MASFLSLLFPGHWALLDTCHLSTRWCQTPTAGSTSTPMPHGASIFMYHILSFSSLETGPPTWWIKGSLHPLDVPASSAVCHTLPHLLSSNHSSLVAQLHSHHRGTALWPRWLLTRVTSTTPLLTLTALLCLSSCGKRMWFFILFYLNTYLPFFHCCWKPIIPPHRTSYALVSNLSHFGWYFSLPFRISIAQSSSPALPTWFFSRHRVKFDRMPHSSFLCVFSEEET